MYSVPDNKTDDDRCDVPLSERNRADAYTGMLDSSVYQPFVFPVEVAMTVYVQVESCGQDRVNAMGLEGLEYVKLTWLEI